ncbi:MAG: FAD-dependent oxidoreductase, partial [Cyanobacteria bacterium P01_F01_bin.53]
MERSDVLIVGGGVMGLAIALELHQQGTQVTIVDRDFTAAAGHAAAGMLAPGAEKIEPGPMAELCHRSLELYPTWASKLEELTGQDSGYWPCGILSPMLASGAPSGLQTAERSHDSSTSRQETSHHLSAAATHSYQSGLSPNIIGAHFYPEDAQIDNRALMKALKSAVCDAGIDIQAGIAVEGFIQRQREIIGLRTSAGERQANHYILATGAWSAELLPIPVTPRKGQMLSLR